MTCCRALWLLVGVEDTVDVKQQGTKGQKNEENNRFVRQLSIVMCPVSSKKKNKKKHNTDSTMPTILSPAADTSYHQ